jgi:hypothetical protein
LFSSLTPFPEGFSVHLEIRDTETECSAAPGRRDFLIKEAYRLPEAIYTRGYDILAPRLNSLGQPAPAISA